MPREMEEKYQISVFGGSKNIWTATHLSTLNWKQKNGPPPVSCALSKITNNFKNAKKKMDFRTGYPKIAIISRNVICEVEININFVIFKYYFKYVFTTSIDLQNV
jgi:hypothetical protein